MGVDAYLKKDKSLPETSDGYVLSFENDGYYWFFYGFFEDLAKQSGQMIDLYDDAFFDGESLDLLNLTIQRARKTISEKPDIWDEFIGTTFEKGVRTKVLKIFTTVRKKELESILTKLETAVAEAKENNVGIFFFGD